MAIDRTGGQISWNAVERTSATPTTWWVGEWGTDQDFWIRKGFGLDRPRCMVRGEVCETDASDTTWMQKFFSFSKFVYHVQALHCTPNIIPQCMQLGVLCTLRSVKKAMNERFKAKIFLKSCDLSYTQWKPVLKKKQRFVMKWAELVASFAWNIYYRTD